MPKVKRPTLTLALTGSFGSGKSTALKCFKQLGAEAIDCDKIAHELTNGRDPGMMELIAKRLGDYKVISGGRLDRQKAASLIFAEPAKRKALEELLHPRIMRRLQGLLQKSSKPIRVVEIPLLFETNIAKFFDAAIVVRAPQKSIFYRLRKKGLNSRQIRARLAIQMPMALKCQKADFILDNSSSCHRILNQASVLYKACLMVIKGRAN